METKDNQSDTRKRSPAWLEFAILFSLLMVISGVLFVAIELVNSHGYLLVGVLIFLVGVAMSAWFWSYKKQCNYRMQLFGDGRSDGLFFFGGSGDDAGGGGDGGGDGGAD